MPTDGTVDPAFPYTETTSADALITPPPTPDATKYGYASGTTTCSSMWICLDALAVCGDVTQMYGAYVTPHSQVLN